MQIFITVLGILTVLDGLMLFYYFKCDAQEKYLKEFSASIERCHSHEGLAFTADEVVKKITIPEFLKQLHGEIIIQQAYLNKEEAK